MTDKVPQAEALLARARATAKMLRAPTTGGFQYREKDEGADVIDELIAFIAQHPDPAPAAQAVADEAVEAAYQAFNATVFANANAGCEGKPYDKNAPMLAAAACLFPALTAEVARLRDAAFREYAAYEDATLKLEQAERERDAMREDAERWRWLCQLRSDFSVNRASRHWFFRFGNQLGVVDGYASIEATIDAARVAQQQGEGNG